MCCSSKVLHSSSSYVTTVVDYLMIGTWMVWKFLDDFKVPNINMVHVITMQVDIIMKEVKKEEFARLKWI